MHCCMFDTTPSTGNFTVLTCLSDTEYTIAEYLNSRSRGTSHKQPMRHGLPFLRHKRFFKASIEVTSPSTNLLAVALTSAPAPQAPGPAPDPRALHLSASGQAAMALGACTCNASVDGGTPQPLQPQPSPLPLVPPLLLLLLKHAGCMPSSAMREASGRHAPSSLAPWWSTS